MKTVGFPNSRKINENRRALTRRELEKFPYKSSLYFEHGYGNVIGVTDDELRKFGYNVVSHDEVLQQDVICDPKAGDSDYIKKLSSSQILFGWIHAVQNPTITDLLLNNRTTVIAWEDMFEDGRHVFWRNNEIAGEAAVLHAFLNYGKLPSDCKVAILGKGNISRGAYKVLLSLGADVTIYDKKTENLLKSEISQYDVFVNAIMWDINRSDHIISKKELSVMKKNSLIIDISCDEGKGVETSKTTSINNPVYIVDDVIHYVVDHTPSIFYKSASESISEEVSKYLPLIICSEITNNPVLNNAMIIKNGEILDEKIIDFQKRE